MRYEDRRASFLSWNARWLVGAFVLMGCGTSAGQSRKSQPESALQRAELRVQKATENLSKHLRAERTKFNQIPLALQFVLQATDLVEARFMGIASAEEDENGYYDASIQLEVDKVFMGEFSKMENVVGHLYCSDPKCSDEGFVGGTVLYFLKVNSCKTRLVGRLPVDSYASEDLVSLLIRRDLLPMHSWVQEGKRRLQILDCAKLESQKVRSKGREGDL